MQTDHRPDARNQRETSGLPAALSCAVSTVRRGGLFGGDMKPKTGNTGVLSNSELSDAITQTFEIISRASPDGPEIRHARAHWCVLLAERERRLYGDDSFFPTLAEQGATHGR